MLEISIESVDRAVVARLVGDLDRAARESLLKAVKAEVSASGGKVVLDCANLTSLDIEGVRALLALQAWLRIKDSGMSLAALPAAMEAPIKSDPGVDDFLTRYSSVNEAKEGLGIAVTSPEPTSPPPAAPPSVSPVAAPPPVEATPVIAKPDPVPAPDPSPWETPVSEPEPISKAAASPPSAPQAGAWETPIAAPDPVAAPPSKASQDVSVPTAPPAGSGWDAPVAETPAVQPKTTEPSAWAKGPPPRPAGASGKSGGKGGLLIGGIVALIVVGLLGWLLFGPSGGDNTDLRAYGPPDIEPWQHTPEGEAGKVPEPGEAIFVLRNVQRESIEPKEGAVTPWADLEISGAEPDWTLTFTFKELPMERPEESQIFVKALGLSGGDVTGDVLLNYSAPGLVPVLAELELGPAEVGVPYTDRVQLDDGGTAIFEITNGAEPTGLRLNKEDGGFSGMPERGSVGTHSFTVLATRGETESEPREYSIVVNEPQSSKESASESAKLLDAIHQRVNIVDKGRMSVGTRREYEKFEQHMVEILRNSEKYVRSAVQVTFPLGGSSVKTAPVEAMLESPELTSWVKNDRVRFLIAGFADKATGTRGANVKVIGNRARNLERVVRGWLKRSQGLSDAAARKKVVVIPNNPSDDIGNPSDDFDNPPKGFLKSRAAECWLFIPPVEN